jgi:hypothetical protein
MKSKHTIENKFSKNENENKRPFSLNTIFFPQHSITLHTLTCSKGDKYSNTLNLFVITIKF